MGFFESADPRLLLVSAAISLVAAYAVYEITDRLRAARTVSALPWLACGSIAVGMSFWGMQYIGMLAYGMPQHPHPSIEFLALSRLSAVGLAAIALSVAAFSALTTRARSIATFIIGCGLVAVHFTDILAAAPTSAQVQVNVPSIALTLVLSMASVAFALTILVRLRDQSGRPARRLRLIGALGLGGGIIVVHSVGMSALRTAVGGSVHLPSEPNEYLVAFVAIVSSTFALAAILAANVDRRIRVERDRSTTLEDLYARERRLAIAFQRALLPASLPSVAGVRFSTSYVPSTIDEGVGGDWFDAFELEDGRVALSIGDAAGNGTSAAIAMNIVRQSFRNAAEECHDPSEVMRRANRVLLRSGSASLVTAIFGFLDPISLELTYACAGHPPPIVADANGLVRTLPGSGAGIPIGIFNEYAVPTQTVVLAEKELIAFYTDGFIEHSRDIISGIALLGAALGAHVRRGDPDPARAIDAAIFGSKARTDDAAIMTIATLASPTTLDLQFPPRLTTAPRARAAVRRYLAGLSVPDDRTFDILVAVGEAVANGIEHAYTAIAADDSIRIRIAHTNSGAALKISIEDRGSWREPRPTSDRGRGIRLMRALADDFHLDEGPAGTRVRMIFSLWDGRQSAAVSVGDPNAGEIDSSRDRDIVEQSVDCSSAHRPMEIKTLGVAAFQFEQRTRLDGGLDALGDDIDVVEVGQLNHHAHDRRAAEHAVGTLDERAIDLK